MATENLGKVQATINGMNTVTLSDDGNIDIASKGEAELSINLAANLTINSAIIGTSRIGDDIKLAPTGISSSNEYIELEYLTILAQAEAIDTGIMFAQMTSSARIETDVMIEGLISTPAYEGCYNAQYYGFTDTKFTLGFETVDLLNYELNTTYQLIWNQPLSGQPRTLYVDGTLASTRTSNFSTQKEDKNVFLYNRDVGFTSYVGRKSYFRIIINEQIALDLIPVIRLSDVIVCWYDKISQQYFGDVTGYHEAGPEKKVTANSQLTINSMDGIVFEGDTVDFEKISNVKFHSFNLGTNSVIIKNRTDTQFELFVHNDGSINTRIVPLNYMTLPSDFPKFTITGKSDYTGNFFITPHSSATDKYGYVFVINNDGEVLWFKRTNSYCHAFRRFTNSANKNRYCYLETITSTYPTEGNVGFYENCELVVLNEDFQEIDRIRNKPYGDIIADYPVENHDYIYIDDGHYIVAAYYRLAGDAKYYNNIQEIKYGKVVWNWSTRDTPELETLSHTTPTTDYAHFNSIMIHTDGNFIISFRNIGLVKLNKETKEIMWVIGENRNDFTGLVASDLPYQQHDVKMYKKDGSLTIFDNFGHETNSRVCRYYLDEENMTATFKEYVTTKDKSAYMGSATMISDEASIFDIAYGSGWNFGFEEYDFINNKQLMSLIFVDEYDLYEVYRDIDEFYTPISITTNKIALSTQIGIAAKLDESIYTPETWSILQQELTLAIEIYNNPSASQSQIDIATEDLSRAIYDLVILPTYTLSNELFDGSRFINTGIKMWDTNKAFSFIIKFKYDVPAVIATPSSHSTLMHNMYEVSPWYGLALQGTKNATMMTSLSLDVNMSSVQNLYTITKTSSLIQDNYIIVAMTRGDSGVTTRWSYLENGNAIVAKNISKIPYNEIATDYKDTELIIGAADMITKMDRFFIGEVVSFEYYENILLNDEQVSKLVSNLFVNDEILDYNI